ncbi:MAG: PD40 domain-containing protein [Bacteroidales bacterium]|nr:PD40 domain-containing protein [Bacteroidales bacterium]
MIRFSWPLAALATLMLAACAPEAIEDVEEYPPIRPDYIGVTVPKDMAPLRFEMRDGRSFRQVRERRGDTLFITVSAWKKGDRRVVRYKAFPIYISSDPIDPFIAYRLIEPNYESWKDIGIYCRELSSWRERAIVTSKASGGGCVNCHHFPSGDPSRMIFHARGRGGGTVFSDNGNARILNLADTGPHRQGTYPAWHPSGRYIAFSSNTTRQSFPISGSQPIEVYDLESDLIYMDVQTDSVRMIPQAGGPGQLETFPAWSPDGSTLYYCRADAVPDVISDRADLHYSLMALDFEEGNFAEEPREVWSEAAQSVSFPRVYGKWMLFTASAYGTFPIWHKEADLMLMNLEDGTVRPADELNSDDTESYHSWSSNGRWVVFSSRRIDGRYTRLYIAHFDGEGHFGKPFLLPQKKPAHNDLRLKSYNIPEFVKGNPGSLQKQTSKLFSR